MITIAFPEHPEERIVFAVSPLLECVLSLHVLFGPKHHALQHAWVRQMRIIDPALRREIRHYGFVFREQLPDAFLPRVDGPLETFDEELERFRRLPPDELLKALVRPLYDHGGVNVFGREEVRRTAVSRARVQGPRAEAAAVALLDDPTGFADSLADTLERYWDACFADEWRRIEHHLADAIAESEDVLADVGIWAVLGRLPVHCRSDRERRELRIDVPHDHRVEITAESPLVLAPSFFTWPHLRVNCDPPWPLALVYPAPAAVREAQPRIPEAELLLMLRAVADDTRLRVLRLIAERPRTTQELEPLVGLSRAGLSKSIRRLAEAGLISSRRDGYYVVYSLVPERIEMLGPTVTRHLGHSGS